LARQIDAARTTLPSEVIAKLRYEVEFKGPEGQEISRTVEAGTNTINLTLALGEWTVSAKAYSTPKDVLAGTGTLPITVTAKMSRIMIPMTTAASASDKVITGFRITDPVIVEGSIDEDANPKTITFDVPYGTDVTNMVTSIVHTGVSISPAEGLRANFTTAQIYTVTALDGSTQAYTVTVTVRNNVATLSSFGVSSYTLTPAFTPDSPGADYTLTVPNSVTGVTLTSTRTDTYSTYTAGSGSMNIDLSGGSGTEAITITSEDTGTTNTYTLTVTRAGSAGLIITIPGDITISGVPASGINLSRTSSDPLTITLADTYTLIEWYLDGVKQTESGATFVRSAVDLQIRQHTLMVMVVKGGLPYSTTITFNVVP